MKAITNQGLFLASVAFILYFSFLFLNAYVLHSSVVLIGVIQQLITLPLMGALLFFFVLAFQRIRKEGFLSDRRLLVAFVFLLISVGATFGSFVIE